MSKFSVMSKLTFRLSKWCSMGIPKWLMYLGLASYILFVLLKTDWTELTLLIHSLNPAIRWSSFAWCLSESTICKDNISIVNVTSGYLWINNQCTEYPESTASQIIIIFFYCELAVMPVYRKIMFLYCIVFTGFTQQWKKTEKSFGVSKNFFNKLH